MLEAACFALLLLLRFSLLSGFLLQPGRSAGVLAQPESGAERGRPGSEHGTKVIPAPTKILCQKDFGKGPFPACCQCRGCAVAHSEGSPDGCSCAPRSCQTDGGRERVLRKPALPSKCVAAADLLVAHELPQSSWG